MTSRRPLFIVVSGAHGVGKTTAVAAASALLEQRGVAVRRFHHIEDTAPDKSATGVTTRPDSQSRPWWRRAVPHSVKMLVTSTFNELRYWRRIDDILAEAARDSQIALADRYAYDRLVDIRLRRRPLIQRTVLRVVASLMRRPTLTILLTDEAAAVYRRKQELSVTEITQYQEHFQALCRRLSAPLTVIPVNGRDADEISRVVVETIVEAARKNNHPMPSASLEAASMNPSSDPEARLGSSP